MLKKLFTASLLGMLCCTSVIIGSNHANFAKNTAPNLDDASMNARAAKKWARKRASFKPGQAADGVAKALHTGPDKAIYQRQYIFMQKNLDELQALANAVIFTPVTVVSTQMNAEPWALTLAYDALAVKCKAIVDAYNSQFNTTSARVTVLDASGEVMHDTALGDRNSLSNYHAAFNPNTAASSINETHAHRRAISGAQLYNSGFGLEKKFSNTLGVLQIYTAYRLGPILDQSPSVRFSENML